MSARQLQSLARAADAFGSTPLDQPLKRSLINTTMSEAFDGAGWSWRTAYDAIEAASARSFLRDGPSALARGNGAFMDLAERLQRWIPTQTIRSTSSNARELFSTPPVLAALASMMLGAGRGSVVLEPSAGNGALAGPAAAHGARLILNEKDPSAAALLRNSFPSSAVFCRDAMIIDAVVAGQGAITHCVMNPPFQHAEAHLAAAFGALAAGGRLVAILPARFRDVLLFPRLLGDGAHVARHLVLAPAIFALAGVSTQTVLVQIEKRPLVRSPLSAGLMSSLTDLRAYAQGLADDRPASSEPCEAGPAPSAFSTAARCVKRAAPAAPAPSSFKPPLPGSALDFSIIEPAPNEACGQSTIYARCQASRIAIEAASPHSCDLVETMSMASVAMPEPQYAPRLPKRIVSRGILSAAQLEAVVYAGQAHSRHIPGFYELSEDGCDLMPREEGEAYRYGFFLADGTGVGKGRTVAGIIMDNLCQGRRKALWISESAALIEDARRDWCDLGGRPHDIIDLRSFNADANLADRQGIFFATYATLRNQGSATRRSRLEQVLEALGEAFDGVIVFDESHAMGSATEIEGFIGKGQASLTGLTGLRLQNALPDARVVYASATGASHVHNIAYATRLGLWGCAQTPFDTRQSCLATIDAGGAAALELLVRELKGRGLFVSRALSYEGVEYEPLEHAFTPEDTDLWDSWSEAWTIIHNGLERALQACGITTPDGETQSSSAKAAARSAFESTKLRFFGHLLQSIQAPTLIDACERDIEAGLAPVVQVTSTNEAVLARRLDKLDGTSVDQLEFTPKEYVIDYLERAFPVAQFEPVYGTDGSVVDARPAVDNEGQRLISPTAQRSRDELLTKLHLMPNCLGALDQLVFHFGPARLAECTGRSRRIIKTDQGQAIDTRGTGANTHEARRFMDGQAELLVFSDAGGTGRSYHASNTARNRKRRVHYLIEPGWRANKALQGLGRSHRNNQACAPLFRVVTTGLAGQKRFTSTISQRLETLGAFTKGDRRSAGEELFSPLDNLSGPLAMGAYAAWVQQLANSKSCVSAERFQTLTGLTVIMEEGGVVADLPPITRWLNRLLALPVAMQNAIFGEFYDLLEGACDLAASEGRLDRSIAELSADRAVEVERHTLPADPEGFNDAYVSVIETMRTPSRIQFDQAVPRGLDIVGHFIERSSGRPVMTYQPRMAAGLDGHAYPVVTCVTPTSRYHTAEANLLGRLDPCAAERCEAAWSAFLAQPVEPINERHFLLHGSCLHLWRGLPIDDVAVRRVSLDTGTTLIGRLLSPEQVERFCSISSRPSVAMVRSALRNFGATVRTSCGLRIIRTRHMDRPCIEIVGFDRRQSAFWTNLGAELVIHNYTPRLIVQETGIPAFVEALFAARPDMAFQL